MAIENSMATGSTYGVSSRPGFSINGRFINGALPLETFEEVIDENLQEVGR